MGYSLVDKLYAGKPFTETADVLGRKVEFRVLSGKQEDEVISSSSTTSYLDMLASRRIPTLARVIVSIDGIGWKDFEEIKQRLRSNPETPLVQAITEELKGDAYTDEILSELYAAYNETKLHYKKTLEDLKKNLTQPNPVTVG